MLVGGCAFCSSMPTNEAYQLAQLSRRPEKGDVLFADTVMTLRAESLAMVRSVTRTLIRMSNIDLKCVESSVIARTREALDCSLAKCWRNDKLNLGLLFFFQREVEERNKSRSLGGFLKRRSDRINGASETRSTISMIQERKQERRITRLM